MALPHIERLSEYGMRLEDSVLLTVSGCKKAFAELKINTSDTGRLEYQNDPEGELQVKIIAGDQTQYDNLIDIEYKDNDFGNMLHFMDMLNSPEEYTSDDFTRVASISMSYVMPDPIVTRRMSELGRSAGDLEKALMADYMINGSTPLLNPGMSTLNRVFNNFGQIGPIIIRKENPLAKDIMVSKVRKIMGASPVPVQVVSLEMGQPVESDSPVYCGRHGLPNGVRNGFALELNPYNPQVASSWIRSIKKEDSYWQIYYSSGLKHDYLTYQKYPLFFRYQSDSYGYLKEHYNRHAMTDYYGFYNIVSTHLLPKAKAMVNDNSPMHVEAEYYTATNVSAVSARVQGTNVSVLVCDEGVLDVDLPVARETRKKFIVDVADAMKLSIVQPTVDQKTTSTYYTVGGHTKLLSFPGGQSKLNGVRSDVYTEYEMVPSVVIWQQQCQTKLIPYISSVRYKKSFEKKIYGRMIRMESEGIPYLIECKETPVRKMIDPLNCHWFEFDCKLYVTYDEPGSFVCVKEKGQPPCSHINPIKGTYMECFSDSGTHGINIPLVKFVKALSGVYQEYTTWSKHRVGITSTMSNVFSKGKYDDGTDIYQATISQAFLDDINDTGQGNEDEHYDDVEDDSDDVTDL